jgi:putative membrane protein
MGFIRMFTMVAGVLLILSSVPAGIGAVDSKLMESDTTFILKITNKVIIGQFVAGVLPILWIGMGSIFVGTLLSNWIGGIPRQISDILRIIVLASLYPTISQFTNIMIYEDNSLTLIPPLLGGLAATLISATILFKKYRKHKEQEMVSD